MDGKGTTVNAADDEEEEDDNDDEAATADVDNDGMVRDVTLAPRGGRLGPPSEKGTAAVVVVM